MLKAQNRLINQFALLFLILASFAICSLAQANVALSKFRIFLDPKTRTDALQLRNDGSKDMRYTLELSQSTMTEDGLVYADIDAPLSAIRLLRYSPKRGFVPAGGRQAIRFAVRKPAGLEDGEYRAVLRVVTESLPTTGGNVNLASKLAYNIPVIVRHGHVEAQASLINPSTVIYNDKPHVQVWLTRSGNRSLFGDFVVESDDGETVGQLNNVAMYRPLTQRKVLIPLENAEKGPVVIRFTEQKKFGGDINLSVKHTLN